MLVHSLKRQAVTKEILEKYRKYNASCTVSLSSSIYLSQNTVCHQFLLQKNDMSHQTVPR